MNFELYIITYEFIFANNNIQYILLIIRQLHHIIGIKIHFFHFSSSKNNL